MNLRLAYAWSTLEMNACTHNASTMAVTHIRGPKKLINTLTYNYGEARLSMLISFWPEVWYSAYHSRKIRWSGCRRASETDGKARQKHLSRALLEVENYKALLEEAKAAVSTANMVPRAELDKSIAGIEYKLPHICYAFPLLAPLTAKWPRPGVLKDGIAPWWRACLLSRVRDASLL